MKNASSLLIVLVFLSFWELGARHVDKSFILPSPIQITIKLWELKEVLLFKHLPVTFLTIIIGLGISIVFGTVIAVWMSSNSGVRKALYPILIASQMIPVIALGTDFCTLVWLYDLE